MLRSVSLKKKSAKCQKVLFLPCSKKCFDVSVKRYDDVDVIVRAANNDSLTILRAVDKESAHEFVQETLQEAWETADDWFIR
ncbi:putative damage-inducible protein dinI-like [Escherichia coli]|nr:putative damage-inducible protein dinI-like [Escherichia coli]